MVRNAVGMYERGVIVHHQVLQSTLSLELYVLCKVVSSCILLLLLLLVLCSTSTPIKYFYHIYIGLVLNLLVYYIS